MKKSLPIWLTLIILIETLPMFIGPLLAILKPSAMAGFGLSDSGSFAWIYAARNFAVGIAFVLAFALKDTRMLFILILIRLITDLHDLPVGLYFGGWSSPPRAIALFTLLYYLPAIYALRYLWKEMNAEKEQ
ncbi:MAG: hypothetical protein JRJ39_10720 [Deltaproteobacteria bacterium]|nr:hypothetical protein [Deltaproteobacteria bacterium]MBW1846341.1 hypothetical protein [Deltaproteobacteria bacterium]MBW2181131.1 hypothetical protein [Deltaproteobacteria bacterium]MBW2364147.1 hypothetical protein [Deltaproteobacteria bacterium]